MVHMGCEVDLHRNQVCMAHDPCCICQAKVQTSVCCSRLHKAAMQTLPHIHIFFNVTFTLNLDTYLLYGTEALEEL